MLIQKVQCGRKPSLYILSAYHLQRITRYKLSRVYNTRMAVPSDPAPYLLHDLGQVSRRPGSWSKGPNTLPVIGASLRSRRTPVQTRVERVLLQHRNADQSEDSHAQEREPDTAEGGHERPHDTLVPTLGQVLQGVKIVTNSLDPLRGVWLVPELLPQA